jgi:hypothetical protein
MSVQLRGGASSDLAGVNTDTELMVALTKALQKAGYAVLAGEASPAGGTDGKLIRAADVSIDRRLRVGVDNPFWDDAFNHAQLNLSKYAILSSTATVAQTGNAVVLNSGNSVASAAACLFRTWRSFPVLGRFAQSAVAAFTLSQAPVANNVIEWGFGAPNTVAPYAPGDGVFMRVTAAGILQLVINVNGSETSEASLLTLLPNTMYEAKIIVDANRTELYINGLLEAAIDKPVNNHVTINPAVPLFARCHNTAATATAQNFRIVRWAVNTMDGNLMRLWPTAMGGMGNNCVNAPDGAAAGQSGNYVNSTGPVSAALSNTAAGYTTLGGQWQFAAVAGAETDYALFGFQVPAFAGAGGPPGRNLIIRGVRIETFNMGAAVATTPHLLQWAIGVGASAVSLATVDSGTAAGRAPRRLPLGIQSLPVGAAVGAAATPIDVNFDAPLIVEPGTFLHLILKMPVASATASQIVRGIATFNAYFE